MKRKGVTMKPIIEINQIEFSYQEEATPALKDISFSINKGEWVAIVGHNGSGKSTLAKAINGLHLPQKGTVTVGGMTLSEESVWDVRRMVGMVFQNPDNQFVGATVEDDVAFGLENQGIERSEMQRRVQDALEKVKMQEFATREPARLSGGQKQRVAIAGVVALRPDIIILDEATSMLDPMGRREINSLVKELNKEKDITIISITHDIEEAKNADQVIMLSAGEVVASGNPKDILSDEANLVKYELDIPFALKVAKGLEKLNIRTSMSLQEEVLITELCQLHLKK